MKLHMFGISNGARAAANGDLPKRLKILGWGDNPAILGLNPKVGPLTLASFGALMKRKGLDRVALDFEHNTVKGTPAWKEAPEPRAVAAFGTPSLIAGDGLYLDDLEYTPQGISHALSYIDLSPAVHIDPGSGEVDFLHSCALTRAGAVEGLSFYSVEAQVDDKHEAGGDAMDWKTWLLGFLEMPEDTADDALKSALADRMKAVATEVVAASAAAAAAAEGHETELTALSTTVATLRDEVLTLSGAMVAMRRQGICDQAAREGKVIPLSAEQVAATEPTLLADMVAKLPVTVPLDRRTPEHVQALSATAASSALAMVAANCGMTAEAVVAANKKG